MSSASGSESPRLQLLWRLKIFWIRNYKGSFGFKTNTISLCIFLARYHGISGILILCLTIIYVTVIYIWVKFHNRWVGTLVCTETTFWLQILCRLRTVLHVILYDPAELLILNCIKEHYTHFVYSDACLHDYYLMKVKIILKCSTGKLTHGIISIVTCK